MIDQLHKIGQDIEDLSNTIKLGNIKFCNYICENIQSCF